MIELIRVRLIDLRNKRATLTSALRECPMCYCLTAADRLHNHLNTCHRAQMGDAE